MNSNPLLIADNISKVYGKRKAVDGLSFEVLPGEIYGFLGPNGAGKSTTIRMMLNLIKPASGEIRLFGKSVTKQHNHALDKVGALIEDADFYQNLSARHNLNMLARMQQTDLKRVDVVLELVDLADRADDRVKAYSHGMKQRLGIAQALLSEPELLILDEPTTGLDPNQIVEIRELIRKIGREKTVILSSHILAEVEATCDRILIINNGKIVANGTPDQLRKQAQGSEILNLKIESGNRNKIFEALQSIPSIALVDFINPEENKFQIQSKAEEKSAKAIFDLCVKNNWYISELIPIETKLEDIFREVTMN